jgi:hypothetical protein
MQQPFFQTLASPIVSPLDLNTYPPTLLELATRAVALRKIKCHREKFHRFPLPRFFYTARMKLFEVPRYLHFYVRDYALTYVWNNLREISQAEWNRNTVVCQSIWFVDEFFNPFLPNSKRRPDVCCSVMRGINLEKQEEIQFFNHTIRQYTEVSFKPYLCPRCKTKQWCKMTKSIHLVRGLLQ